MLVPVPDIRVQIMDRTDSITDTSWILKHPERSRRYLRSIISPVTHSPSYEAFSKIEGYSPDFVPNKHIPTVHLIRALFRSRHLKSARWLALLYSIQTMPDFMTFFLFGLPIILAVIVSTAFGLLGFPIVLVLAFVPFLVMLVFYSSIERYLRYKLTMTAKNNPSLFRVGIRSGLFTLSQGDK